MFLGRASQYWVLGLIERRDKAEHGRNGNCDLAFADRGRSVGAQPDRMSWLSVDVECRGSLVYENPLD